MILIGKLNFNNQINAVLKGMRTGDMKKKGDLGEESVFMLCEKLYQRHGGILYHSYSYKVDPKLPGNIKKDESGKLYKENLGAVTEIDILYVSPYKVFPIEVKSYSSKEIILTDDGIDGVRANKKSPIHQNEMHCRHLYSNIFRALPDCEESYIVPIVVFVDRCTLVDKRSDWQKKYILKAILNNVLTEILRNNVAGKYGLDLVLVDRVLKEKMTDCSKYLPVRIL